MFFQRSVPPLKQFRSILTLLLSLCLVLGCLPLSAKAADAHTHCHCLNSYDSDYCVSTHNASQTWKAWTSTTSLPSSAGYYYLTADVELNYTWDAPTGIRLCLNNHTITHTKTTGSVMKVRVTDVVLTDCTPGNQVYNGGIRYGNGTTVNGKTCGGGIFVDGGYLYIYRTDIRHNDADYGGGIYITGNGSVNLYSRASLNQNGAGFADGAGKNATYGGNIYMDYGWLKTYSCEIMNGRATTAGGGVYMKGVSCYMDHYASVGGIHANHVTGSTGSGGGVYVGSSAYLNIHGSGYIGMNSAPNGGGVYAAGHLTMNGGNVSQNSASVQGGGVYLSVNSPFDCNGGYIGYNTCSAADGAGGVYTRSSQITLSGETRIMNNTAKGSASNLKLNDTTHRTFTVDGALTGKANICVSADPGVDFSKGWNTYMGSTDPETYVHSDLSGYDVIQNPTTKELTLGLHEHSWSYTSATTAATYDTVSESCRCGAGGKIWLTAPALASGTGSAEATVNGSFENTSVTVPAIRYAGTGETSYAESSSAPRAPGTYRASIIVSGVTAYVDYTLTAVPATVTAWPTAAEITYGQTLADSALSGGEADVPGTFAWTDGSIKPAVGTASYDVTFTPADESYTAVTQPVSVTVHQAETTVTKWPTALNFGYGNPLRDGLLVDGEASVPGTFAWKDPDHLPEAGTYTGEVIFTPADSGYKSVSGTVSVTVLPAGPYVTAWPTAAEITYGQTLADSALSGGEADVEGTFAWETADIKPEAGTKTYHVVFTPADSKNYSTFTGNVSVTVRQAELSVTKWPTASELTYGQTLADSALSGGEASVPGTFAWDNDTLKPFAGDNSCFVVFTPEDSNYAPVTEYVTVQVKQADPDVTAWPTASELTYGQTLSDSTLSGGTAAVAGTFAWKDGSVKPDAGSASYEVTFTPEDKNYASVTMHIPLNVAQADPDVTELPTAAQITYGQTLADSALSGGTAAVPGTFQWEDASVKPDVGTDSFSVIFVPEDSGYSTFKTQVSVTVRKAAAKVINWPAAASITFGERLSASALTGGEAEVPGTFAWKDGTNKPDAGAASFEVVFTPDDAERYEPVSSTVALTVYQGEPEITENPVPGEITYGTALKDVPLTGGAADAEGTFSWKDPEFVPEAGTQILDVIFIPADNNLKSVTVQVAVNVAKADAGVTAWPTASDLTYGQTLADSALTGGTADAEGTFAWEDPDFRPLTGSISVNVVFSPADDNYAAASKPITVLVSRAKPVITWAKETQSVIYTGKPAEITAPTVQLVAGEEFTGTILYSFTKTDTAARQTVWQNGLPTEVGTYTVRATVAEFSNYESAYADMTLTILPKTSEGGEGEAIPEGGTTGGTTGGNTGTGGTTGGTTAPSTGDEAMPVL